MIRTANDNSATKAVKATKVKDYTIKWYIENEDGNLKPVKTADVESGKVVPTHFFVVLNGEIVSDAFPTLAQMAVEAERRNTVYYNNGVILTDEQADMLQRYKKPVSKISFVDSDTKETIDLDEAAELSAAGCEVVSTVIKPDGTEEKLTAKKTAEILEKYYR